MARWSGKSPVLIARVLSGWALPGAKRVTASLGKQECCAQVVSANKKEVRVTSKVTGAGKVPIRRAEMSTQEMDVIADLINRQYVEHKAWFRCPAPSRVDAGLRLAATGSLEAAVGRYRGFDYHAQASGPEDHLALVVLNGEGTFTRSGEQLRFARGDVILLASGERFMTDMYDFAYALVRISPHTLTALAEEYTGLPPGSMRIESMAPVSRAARARWSQTSAFICCQLLDSPSAGISPIVAKEMTRLAAATDERRSGDRTGARCVARGRCHTSRLEAGQRHAAGERRHRPDRLRFVEG